MCGEGLARDAERRLWACEQGHSFDVAREGYVNLLITHQRRQREPGDSAEMIAARRTFLDGGWYEPLLHAIDRHAPRDDEVACDAGCGEGYYSRGWPSVWAIDIAKPAVRLAARRASEGANYAVASVYAIPLPDASVDVVLSVFAPLHSPEFERVLRPGGRVITVTPGPDHLAGLARELFEVVEPHPASGPFDRPGATTPLRPADAERIRFDLDLQPPAIGALLGMTPYAWYVDSATRARIAGLDRLVTPADFFVHVYLR